MRASPFLGWVQVGITSSLLSSLVADTFGQTKQVKDDVRAGVLSLVEKERQGEMVDRDLLKQVVDVSIQ